MIIDGNTIRAESGMKLTNGTTYASTIRLADWDSPDNYNEITEEEYNAIMAETEEIEP